MFLCFLMIKVVSTCNTGEVQSSSGCVSICNDSFYNQTTATCQKYNDCTPEQYLNITTNSCINTCTYGYYNNGICTCYAGWKNSTNGCIQDQNYKIGTDYTLGLDWLYWALIFIFLTNILYISICHCRLKKNFSNPISSRI